MDPVTITATWFPVQRPRARLGWHSAHDTRSLAYGIRPHLAEVGINVDGVLDTHKRWAPGTTLDQQREGACVPFAWMQEALSSPRPFRTTAELGNARALADYDHVRGYDRAMGNHWNDGASILAGALHARDSGRMDGFRWAWSIDDLAAAVVTTGPAVIGIPWLEDMYDVPPDGVVRVGGDLVGGHALLIDEYHPARRVTGRAGRVRGFGWHNSWSDDYGRRGRAFIAADDLAGLIAGYAELCVPVGRKRIV